MKQIFYTSGYYMVCNTFLINTVVQASILAYGAYLISENLVSSRILLAFMLYQGILQEYTQNLLNSFTSLIKSSGAAAKVFEYIKRVPKCQGGMSRVDNDDDDVVIAYENVRFCYPNRPETLVLKGIDLKIPRGSVVALVGPSGAGKSTLFHLLQHYYEPQLGYVRLNGLNVSKILHSSLHAYISLVSQEPVLMSGTSLSLSLSLSLFLHTHTNTHTHTPQQVRFLRIFFTVYLSLEDVSWVKTDSKILR